MADVTRLIDAAAAGDPKAAAELLPVVYDELRKLAAARLSIEAPGQTLQATALVHEAYIRLVGGAQSQDWNGRGHFFAAAAEAMRRILIENARRKKRQKRGGTRERVDLDNPNLVYQSSSEELLAIDDALERLAAEAPDAALMMRLRYFAGLSTQEAAEMAGLARSTAYEHWAYARAWLRCRLQGEDPSPA
jgi:RNA polymerase sigma factor (TIGR02999 family)